MRVLYFGYWYPGGGHMLRKPSGYSEREDTLPPELRRLDGPFAGDPAKIKGYYDGVHGKQTVPHWDTNDQEQGLGRLHHVAGWTVLTFWDRSGDTRGKNGSAGGIRTMMEIISSTTDHTSFSDDVIQGATFWFVLGMCALWETGAPDVVPSFTVLTAEGCIAYALEIVYPILVLAPQEPVDWEAVLDS